MAIPLQSEEIKALHRMIGGGVGFTLLYKISRDGCNASTFHSKCDRQGPTITVFYNTNDTVYGGYTSKSWLSTDTENCVCDERAFLFQVRFNGISVQKKYPIKADNYENAIRCGSNLGPVFGRKESDIPFFTGDVNPTNGIFTFHKGQLNESYNLNSENITNDSVDIKDLEVYKVYVGDLQTTLNQWRSFPKFEQNDSLFDSVLNRLPFRRKNKCLDALRKDTLNYSPLRNTGVEHVNLLLIGHVGAGKSSFFNTVNSIFKGSVSHQAVAGSTERSLTDRFKKYQIRNRRYGRPLHFRLCDTKGIEKDDGIDPHEFCFILDGNMPSGHLFNSSTQLSPDSPGFLAKPSTQDRMHAVVIIIDSTVVEIFEHGIRENIRILQAKANHRGIPQVVLLTKIDKVSESLKNDVSKTFHVPKIWELVDKAADLFGLPRANVFPIKNYEDEMELREDVNTLALLALQQILNFADDYLANFLEN